MLQYRKDKIHPSLQTSDSLSSEHNGAPSFAHDWFILDNPISSRPSSTLGITKTQYLKGNEAEDVLHAEEWLEREVNSKVVREPWGSRKIAQCVHECN